MALEIDCLAIDCADPDALARFWASVLGYTVIEENDPDEVMLVSPDRRGTRLLFLKVPEGKSVKNRLHLDLRPGDQAAEVERVTGLGARRVDVGPKDVTWSVPADPEGNEFCVLRALTPEDHANRVAQGVEPATD